MDAANRPPEEYREPPLLAGVRGMSYKQIADLMGVPVTTVETRLARARRMVREELERSGSGAGGAGGAGGDGRGGGVEGRRVSKP